MSILKLTVVALSLSALLITSGCTSSLQTNKEKESGNQGVYYSLPATKIKVTLTHELLSCEDGQIGEGNSDTPQLTFMTKAGIAQLPAVQDEAYFIDVDALHKWNKAFSLDVDYYDSGLPKKIKVGVEDKSIDFATGVIKGAADIALLSQGIPPVITATSIAGFAPLPIQCASEVEGNIFNKKIELTTKLNRLTAEIATNNTSINAYKKIIAKEGTKPADIIASTAESNKLILANSTLENDLNKTKSKLNQLTKLLTVEQTRIIALAADVTINKLDYSGFTKWLKGDPRLLQHHVNQLYGETSYQFDSKGIGSSYSSDQATTAGIYYSVFGDGTVTLTGNNNSSVIFHSNISAPEFGHTALLSYDNMLGEANSLDINYNTLGGIQKINYAQTKVSSDSVSEGISKTIEQATVYVNSKDSAEKAKQQAVQSSKLSAFIAASATEGLTPHQIAERQQLLLQLYAVYGNSDTAIAAINLQVKDMDNDKIRELIKAL